MDDLAGRMANRIQLSSTRLRPIQMRLSAALARKWITGNW